MSYERKTSKLFTESYQMTDLQHNYQKVLLTLPTALSSNRISCYEIFHILRTKGVNTYLLLNRKCFASIFAVRHLIITRLEQPLLLSLGLAKKSSEDFFSYHITEEHVDNSQQLLLVLAPFHPNDKLNNGKQTLINAFQGKKD